MECESSGKINSPCKIDQYDHAVEPTIPIQYFDETVDENIPELPDF